MSTATLRQLADRVACDLAFEAWRNWRGGVGSGFTDLEGRDRDPWVGTTMDDFDENDADLPLVSDELLEAVWWG